MFNDRWTAGLYGRAVFDPSGGLITAGMMAAGTALSAGGTLAAGSAAKQAGQMSQAAANFQALQARLNSGQAIASSQRTMLDTQNKTNLAISSATADAAANGVNAGAGSAVTNVGDLAKRGSYLASMDLFNGKSVATGLLNEANGAQYTGEAAALEGQEKQQASYLAAGGTAASGAGSAISRLPTPATPTPSGTYWTPPSSGYGGGYGGIY